MDQINTSCDNTSFKSIFISMLSHLEKEELISKDLEDINALINKISTIEEIIQVKNISEANLNQCDNLDFNQIQQQKNQAYSLSEKISNLLIEKGAKICTGKRKDLLNFSKSTEKVNKAFFKRMMQIHLENLKCQDARKIAFWKVNHKGKKVGYLLPTAHCCPETVATDEQDKAEKIRYPECIEAAIKECDVLAFERNSLDKEIATLVHKVIKISKLYFYNKILEYLGSELFEQRRKEKNEAFERVDKEFFGASVELTIALKRSSIYKINDRKFDATSLEPISAPECEMIRSGTIPLSLAINFIDDIRSFLTPLLLEESGLSREGERVIQNYEAWINGDVVENQDILGEWDKEEEAQLEKILGEEMVSKFKKNMENRNLIITSNIINLIKGNSPIFIALIGAAHFPQKGIIYLLQNSPDITLEKLN